MGLLKKINKIIFINFWGRKEKNYFFDCIFDISPCFVYSNFDQESSLDVELNSTSNEYPLGIILMDPATQKQEIPKKMEWWCHHSIFQVFLIFGVARSVKSMPSGYSLDAEFNSTSNELSNQNLSKNTGRYVTNTNKKSSFFYDTYPQIYNKKMFKTYTVFQI